MKKKYLLFFFSMFLILPFSTHALTFNGCDNTEYNVNDYSSLLGYCYFNYIRDNSNSKNVLMFMRGYSDVYVAINYSNDNFFFNSNDRKYNSFDNNYKLIKFTNLDSPVISDGSGIDSLMNPTFLFSTFDIFDSNNNIYNRSNKTLESLAETYSCDSVFSSNNQNEEPEEPDTPSSGQEEPDDTTKVSKEDFYVLLTLLSTLIWLLYFKWCFPMKGGKKV